MCLCIHVFVMLSILQSLFIEIEKGFKKTKKFEQNVVLLLFLVTLEKIVCCINIYVSMLTLVTGNLGTEADHSVFHHPLPLSLSYQIKEHGFRVISKYSVITMPTGLHWLTFHLKGAFETEGHCVGS